MADVAEACERVAFATVTMLALDGAPHPFAEFADAVRGGELVRYELIHVTRSLQEIVIETGIGMYGGGTAGNVLRRVTVFRSIEDGRPVLIGARQAQSGAYYLRRLGTAPSSVRPLEVALAAREIARQRRKRRPEAAFPCSSGARIRRDA